MPIKTMLTAVDAAGLAKLSNLEATFKVE